MADVQTLRFADDGEVPNNDRLPVIHYPAAVAVAGRADPARPFEVLFARNGWTGSWRNGIYAFRHYHPSAHEVLGLACGTARVELGGARGRIVTLQAGDVVVLPAGTSHRRIESSADLLVVGAYPSGSRVDHKRAGEVATALLRSAIAGVSLPASDPVHGVDGPLCSLWRAAQENPS